MFQFVYSVSHRHSDFKNIPKKLIWLFTKIVISDNNENVFWLEIVDYSQTLECYKSRTCYKNVTETWICDMYEHAKLCIVMKMIRVFVKKWMPFHSSDFRKEINNNICRWSTSCLKNVGNSFFYWHLHSSQDEFQKCWS